MKYLSLLLLPLLFIGAGCKQCVKSHQALVHHKAYTTMQHIVIGKATTLIPIRHPARDVMENVCDQYAE